MRQRIRGAQVQYGKAHGSLSSLRRGVCAAGVHDHHHLHDHDEHHRHLVAAGGMRRKYAQCGKGAWGGPSRPPIRSGYAQGMPRWQMFLADFCSLVGWSLLVVSYIHPKQKLEPMIETGIGLQTY